MLQSPDDRRPAITPQLAVRVAIMGGIAFALFAIIFFRLWFLQVLSGDQYLAEARNNQVRDVKVEAPRGDIVDRNGTVLVESRHGVAVLIDPQKIPAAERDLAEAYGSRLAAAERSRRARHAKKIRPVALPALPAGEVKLARLYRRLGRVIGMSPRSIHREVLTQVATTPYSSVTLKADVPRTVYSYILERQKQFPGVTVQDIYLRSYPHDTLAAQLFGTVGEVSPDELKLSHFRDVGQGTRVGKTGIEYAYDRYLRGDDGATRIQVDSLGRPEGELSVRRPKQGKQLKLSIDLGLQAEGQRAVAKALSLARSNGDPATAGGFVALDPRNGEVLAMGSYPSFDPNIFAKPLSQAKFDAIQHAPGSPLYNRALSGLYPTGSTFKPITALASLNSGVITRDTPINDPGCVKVGEIERCNAGKTPFGTVSLVKALQVSSDVFFYTLGMQTNPLKGQVIQTTARKLGLGRLTGIDIPGEVRGLIPDRAWRDRIGRKELKCRAREHKDSCGISDARPWTVGDNVNLAVGQGDVQATPLQMAVAYAAIANGGRVIRPHLGLEIEDNTGRVLQKIEPPAARTIKVNPAYRAAIMDGLHAAASAEGGTSAQVFEGWPQDQYPVFGKTGTAQRPPFADQSWYVAYVPNKTRPIVVAVTIEQGGWGAQAAAPATRLMLSQWFNVKKKLVEGDSHTR